MISTKELILNAAIELFSDKGYDKVSMRNIAAMVGIKAASIYNHFPSKHSILKNMYDFYAREHRRIAPQADELLKRLETEALHTVIAAMSYHWPPQIQDKMDRILLVAIQRISLDNESVLFLQEHFFQMFTENLEPLIKRAVELGKIEAIDVDTFLLLGHYFAFTAAYLQRTPMKITPEQWQKGFGLLFSLLKPVISGKMEKGKENKRINIKIRKLKDGKFSKKQKKQQ